MIRYYKSEGWTRAKLFRSVDLGPIEDQEGKDATK